MSYQHKELAGGRWFELDLAEQLANIGSEVERAILWRDRNEDYSRKAFYRVLELLELTLSDKKNRKYSLLKELCRLKEVLIDFFCGDNNFSSSDELMRKYFYAFAYMARR
ncbi:MAG: hypothetical protein AB1567_02865 [bacterium]